MAASPAAVGDLTPRQTAGRTPALPRKHGHALAIICVCGLAAALRLWAFARVPPNPFYDASVRSMALSWHNFFYGAFEPGGAVSVDKAPLDLWLQVASTKLFGFSSVALRLPQAAAGTLAVALLYDLVRRGFGRSAGLVSALALAVLPVAVLTGRSDTMDTLMGTLLLLAAWTIVAVGPERRARAVALAGAIAGLAFEVKLFEVVVALPAIAALAWLSLHASHADRRRTLGRAAIAFVAVAAAWPVLAGLAPGTHPWPLGSTDGSLENVILVYNGVDRLGYPTAGQFSASLPGPGPLRLFTGSAPDYVALIGAELLPALVLGALAAMVMKPSVVVRAVGDDEREPLAVGAGVGLWLVSGFAFFSIQGRPRLRYMEVFTPAVAAGLGIGLVVVVGAIAQRQRWPAGARLWLVATLASGLLAWPLATSVALSSGGAEDSQTLGAMPEAQVSTLSRYLGTHQRSLPYEIATSDPVIAAPLIVRDAQPVLMLTSWYGQPLTSPAQLAALVRTGAVRHLLLAETGCRTRTAPSCAPAVRWALAHGTDVSGAAGLGRGRILLRLATA
jgi:4-amino-4-deoxy-L-arabinose transferase-like glycosyltransferase